MNQTVLFRLQCKRNNNMKIILFTILTTNQNILNIKYINIVNNAINMKNY
jgi:hypothetical protein